MKILTPNQFIQLTKVASSKFDVDFFNGRMEIAKYAVEFFQSSFRHQKVQGSSLNTWAARRREYSWPILQKTQRLKNSIKWELLDGRGLRIATDVPYSQFHNDPQSYPSPPDQFHTYSNYRGPWRRNQYTSELADQRQFMGFSPILERFIQRRVEAMAKAAYSM